MTGVWVNWSGNTLPEDNKQIFAGKYETVLPSKEALQKLLKEQMEDDEN